MLFIALLFKLSSTDRLEYVTNDLTRNRVRNR